MRFLIALALILFSACGQESTTTRKRSETNAFELLRGINVPEAALRAAITSKYGPAGVQKASGTKSFRSSASIVTTFMIAKKAEPNDVSFLGNDPNNPTTGDLGKINYVFSYADIDGNAIEGEISANFIFDVYRFVEGDPRYTVTAVGVTAELIGTVQHGILDALTPTPLFDAGLENAIVTFKYQNLGNATFIKTAQTNSNGEFSIRVFKGVPIQISAELEGFDLAVTTATIPTNFQSFVVNIVLWPHPTNNPYLVAATGTVYAYRATETTNGSPFVLEAIQGATVNAVDSQGFLIPGTLGSQTNSAGNYYVAYLPVGTSYFQANKGSKAATTGPATVTMAGPNVFDIVIPTHRPYCTLSLSSTSAQEGDEVGITVTGTDYDNEILYYAYDVTTANPSRGLLLEMYGYGESTNRWRAPSGAASAGVYYISATVNDGALFFTCQASVTVTGALTPSAAPAGRVYHTGVWTGTHVIIAGGQNQSGTPFGDSRRYDSNSDSWYLVAATTPRSRHLATWTGSEMIVWGGQSGANPVNTGFRYNPSTDSWVAMSTVNQPSVTSNGTKVPLWTGTEFLVYDFGASGRYSPSTDSWQAIATYSNNHANASAVWSGTEMIVFGGQDGQGLVYYNDGGRFNPSTNTWSPISTVGAPAGRANADMVWTGSEMLVWGGWTAIAPGLVAGGGKYNPTGDIWIPMNTVGAPPAARLRHLAWTGSAMIVWGGFNGSTWLNTGGMYDPNTDSWTTMSTSLAPSARSFGTAVWTGSHFVVWGGSGIIGSALNDGAVFDPTLNQWSSMAP